MNRYSWLLFDLDNTLLDFDKSSKQAFISLIQELGISEDTNHLYKKYQSINHALWADREAGKVGHEQLKTERWKLFFEDNGIEYDPSKANAHYFEIISQRVDFVDFAPELLNKLSNNYRMAIVTNGLSEVQRPRLSLSEIDRMFEHIVISDEIGSAKPQEAFFKHCHKLIETPHKEVLVIGDTLKSDVKGGNEFGYDTCWFNHDVLPPDGENEAKYEVNHLRELLRLLGF